MTAGGFRADVTPEQAWATLKANAKASLVDVRTAAEWVYVGLPDLSTAGQPVFKVEWQSFPDMAVNAGFAGALDEALRRSGRGPDDPVYFICRSGVRSAAAAVAMTEAGYSNCFNVEGGFEGQHDDERQRGNINGWKAAGLPWFQS